MFNRGRIRGKSKGFGFGGFALGATKKEAPATAPVNPNPFVASSSSSSAAAAVKHKPKSYQASSRHASSKPMFNDDSDDEVPYTVYSDDDEEEQQSRHVQQRQDDEDDEEDELDKFMAGIESEVKREKSLTEEEKARKRVRRDDLEEEDDQESYFNYVKNQPITYYPDDDEEIEYDEDGNPIIPERKKIIEPLPPIDHAEIDYFRFEKNFYIEHKEISKLSHSEMFDLRLKLGIRVTGAQPVRPCTSFAHFGFDEQLIESIRKSDYSQPTPIQCQSIPVALNGRDIIGVAKTGSGKTAAFLWPMLVHVMDQPELEPGDGPIGLILAPTRELCQQIFFEAKKFGKVYNLKVCCVFGGGNMYEQSKTLSEGVEIVVATPGRLIDHIKKKATNLQRVTYIVFDEADRMFDMGFEPQVRSIANHVRPDRQCLLFSATFKKKVEMLCRDILTDPIRIVIGELGEANEDVTQLVKVFSSGPEKWDWLITTLVSYTSAGSVLIFVTKKANSEELASNLKKKDFEVGLLHGDMDQYERNNVITSFRKKEFPVLVATDVAARGLDIPSIKTVINYDVARDIHTHTHRIGRTGRAGEKGVAYTLITPLEQNFCGDLVRNLEGANQDVPDVLMEMAMKNAWFRKSRFRGGKGKGGDGGGSGGRRVKDRPGLGSDEPAHSGGVFSSGSGSIGGRVVGRGVLGGPGSDRFSSIKAAFKSQYTSHFKAAASSNSNTWDASKSHSTAEPLAPPPRKPKKTRWDPA